MREQVVHCPTDAEDRSMGIFGSTWIIQQSPTARNYVLVQYSVCSPDDQFSRKKGVSMARQHIVIPVHKAHLIEYVSHVRPHKGDYYFPTVEQIYQAVIRL